MGDVALLVPVVRSCVATYQDVEITVVTRPKFAPFFYDIPRVIAFPADVDYTYTGIFGMRDLFRTLIRKGDYEVVIDMHDHIRTMILRTLFKVFGTKVVVFEKGRHEKKLFTKKDNKIDRPLRHTVVRYQEAFERSGFPFNMVDGPYFTFNPSLEAAAQDWLDKSQVTKAEPWIGIAPFAMHATKIWPLENWEKLMTELLEKQPVKFFLFGGGEKEVRFLKNLRDKFPDNAYVVAGELKVRQEMVIMKQLDAMVCLDSSNMHLAALTGVRVISIWGGTHPDVGFSPYKAPLDSMLQISRSELPCRPCSVYGRETCYVGGYPCLTRISPALVAERTLQHINTNA